jgi:hypothetical protein
MKSGKYVSAAQINFENSSWDIYHLFDIHDELISNAHALQKKEKADVLVRSTYLFITACWESYIEDLCEEALSLLLSKTIKSRKWIRSVLKQHREELIQDFNTPKSSNINKLYLAVIGLTNLSNSWQWSGMTTQQSQAKLGTYIKIRGVIAHRTRTSESISRKKSEEYLDFVKILVSKTESRVQNYVKRLTGTNFGKINRR